MVTIRGPVSSNNVVYNGGTKVLDGRAMYHGERNENKKADLSQS